MVLRTSRVAPAACALGALLALGPLAGCKQSLFDEGGDGSNDPDVVGSTCPAECLGDAARDFNAAAPKAGWRYVEDRRDRSWAAMAAAGKRAVGGEPANAITPCAERTSAAACAELPGALLVSTAGGTTSADPGFEFTVTTKRVVKVGVRAFVPTSAPEQQVRIYRNSREDSLFTGPATPGAMFEKALSADVLPGDRLLVVFAPASGGATDIGVELFLSDIGTPSSCQLALSFEDGVGNSTPNACGTAFTSLMYQDTGPDTELPAVLGPGPFPELGKAAVIAPGKYYKGVDVLNKAGDVTLQFWMKINAVDPIYIGYPYSDHDLNGLGGLSVDIFSATNPTLESFCPIEDLGVKGFKYAGGGIGFPNFTPWTFIRLSHKAGKVAVCINGTKSFDYDVPAGKLSSAVPPYLGKNVTWGSQGAFFDGSMDDVRFLSTALPCE